MRIKVILWENKSVTQVEGFPIMSNNCPSILNHFWAYDQLCNSLEQELSRWKMYSFLSNSTPYLSSSSSILTQGTHRPRIALIDQINHELCLLTKRDICAGAQSLGIELLLSSVALVDPAKWQGSSSGDGLWCCWVASQAGTLHWGPLLTFWSPQLTQITVAKTSLQLQQGYKVCSTNPL